MSLPRLTLSLGACAVLAACSMDLAEFASKWIDEQEIETIDRTFALVEAEDWEGVRSSFHESVEDPGSDEAYALIAEVVRGADLTARSLIGVNVNTTNERRNTVLTYEGPASPGWYVATVRLRDRQLYGFNVVRTEESLVSTNAFRLGAVGLSHALLLGLGLISMGVAAFASYRVLNSSIQRRKLWAVLPWIMVGTLTLDWTTGDVGIQLLRLQLPPVTFIKSGPAAPWMFGFGLPVFALLALRKVRRLSMERSDHPEEEAPAT